MKIECYYTLCFREEVGEGAFPPRRQSNCISLSLYLTTLFLIVPIFSPTPI